MQLKLKTFIWTTILLAGLIIVLPGWGRESALAAVNGIDSPDAGNIVALDHFKSAFTIGGKATTSVRFQINSGSSAKLEFAVTGNSAGWEIALADSIGPLKLLGNTHYETNLAATVNVPYTVFVNARAVSPSLTEGASTSPVLSVYSGVPVSDSSQLRFAIPAPFVYALSDSQRRNSLRLAYLSPNANMEAIELLSFAGTNLAVSAAKVGENKYVLAWEDQVSTTAQNIVFSIFNNVGTGLVHRKTLFENSLAQNEDSLPFVAASPNGKFGILFARKHDINIPNQVYFQLVNQDGSNVNNAAAPLWVGTGVDGISSPRLIGLPADGDQYRMLALWYNLAGEVWGASINITADNNNYVQTPALKIDSTAIWPVIIPLSDGRSFIAYNKDTSKILANDMQSDLTSPDQPRFINGTNPIPRGAVQFSNGNILLAWTDVEQVKLSMFNANVSVDPVSVDLNFTYIPEPRDVSITLDRQGRAIVFWTNALNQNFLYYALIDSSGTVLTPPMVFRDSRGAYEFIIGPNGQGLVGLNGLFAQFLPNIAR